MKKEPVKCKILLIAGMALLAVSAVGCFHEGDKAPAEQETPARGDLPYVPFSGSSDQGEDTEDPEDTDRVRIVFNPRDSALATPCDQILLVQVLQIFEDGIPVHPDPGRSDPINNVCLEDDPDTTENEEKTCVDNDGWLQPGYNAPNAAEGEPGYFPGADENAQARDSTMVDTPSGKEGVRKEFEVCAFCARGEDCPKFFECITWTYERPHRDDLDVDRRGISRITGQSDQPSAKFRKAFEKFNKVRGYVPCHEEGK